MTYGKDLSMHPCFSHKAHFLYGRIHLPVAPRCNISCNFCDRKYDCVNESRPGVTSRVLTPEEALDRLEQALREEPSIRVAGIAGPGEPLYNEETFETFDLIHRYHPELLLCVSSNGLLLERRLEDLLSCGVSTLTVTINALDLRSANQIYHDVFLDQYPARQDRLRQFLTAQRKGLYRACQAGMTVKINTVLIPGINEDQIQGIAEMGKDAGATIMNIMPLIPCGKMRHSHPPDKETMQRARELAECYIPQFLLCRQCRADACGIPGREHEPRI